jgi:hypothetical protein
MNRPGKLPNYVERVIALRQRVKSEKGAEEVVMTSDAYAALGPLQTDWGKVGYPLHSGSPNILWLASERFSVPIGDDLAVRRRLHGHGLLH